MQRGFAEFLAGLFVDLFGQVLFEGNRLLMMKQLEIAVLVIFLKACDGFGHTVDSFSLWRIASLRNEKYLCLTLSLSG